MPYIPEERKLLLPDTFFHQLVGQLPNAGDMNYLFTKIAHEYIEWNGLRYQYINDVLGALTGARSEFYRRVAQPYENQCIAKNGDVMSTYIEDVLYR